MKPAFAFLTMAVVLVGLTGCGSVAGLLSPHGHGLIDGSCGHCDDCPETCQSCDCDGCGPQYCGDCDYDGCGRVRGCGLLDRMCCGRPCVNPGPPTGAVTYPYYTVRGPRDFLMKTPRPLGP